MGSSQTETDQGGRLQSQEGNKGSFSLCSVFLGATYWGQGLLCVFLLSWGGLDLLGGQLQINGCLPPGSQLHTRSL